MRTQKITRTRAWCDHCKKGMWCVKKMEVHQEHCTMNPNRVCRVCKTLLEQEQPELSGLVARCRAQNVTMNVIGGIIVPETLHAELVFLTNDCPACEMAALRQSGIPCGAVEGFNFTKRMKEIWQDINEAKLEECNYGY